MLSKQLQEQIEQEAKAGQHTHPGTDYGHGFNKGYDSGYKFAGEKYAALYETAVARAERAEKALKKIQEHIQTAQVNEMGIAIVIAEALTPKTGEDES